MPRTTYPRVAEVKTRCIGEQVYYGSVADSYSYIGSIEKGDGRNQWNIDLAAQYGAEGETFSGSKAEAAERLTELYKEATDINY